MILRHGKGALELVMIRMVLHQHSRTGVEENLTVQILLLNPSTGNAHVLRVLVIHFHCELKFSLVAFRTGRVAHLGQDLHIQS